MRKNTFGAFFVMLLLMTSMPGCKKLKGEFAFKTAFDDNFRRVDRLIEVDSEKELQWAYIFKHVTGRREIVVNLQKKEIGWVEINVRMDYISAEKPALHGSIKGYPPGTYRLILIDVKDKNRIIDSRDFFVYSDGENFEN